MEQKKAFILLFIYSFILLFFCSESSPLYSLNHWCDVNVYFNIGKTIMNGQILYQDVFDHKGPLIFFIYGIAYLISNDTFLGAYIIESLFLFMALSYVYLTSKLYVNKYYSLIVALCFSLLSLEHSVNGGSAEEFILMLFVVGMYYFIKYFKEADKTVPKWVMFRLGILSMLVFLIKLNLVSFFVFPVFAILLQLLYKKEYKILMINSVYFISGLFIVLLPLLVYFISTNSAYDFWFSYFEFNRMYSVIVIDYHFFLGLAVKFSKLLFVFPFYTFFIVLGILIFLFTSVFIKNIWGRVGLLLSTIMLFVSIFGVRYILLYYYIPLTVYGFLGCLYIAYLMQKKLKIESAHLKYTSVLCIVVALLAGCSMKKFFGESPSSLFRGERRSTVDSVFTEALKNEKQPTLLALGLDEGICLFTKANIVPNTKYFFYPNIFYPSYPVVRDTQEKYIQEKSVQYIIICNIAIYYDYFVNSEALKTNYSVVDTYKDPVNNNIYYLYRVNE